MHTRRMKKGLLAYASVYGSTVETAYWIRCLIGHEYPVDVKPLTQIVTVEPYDYVIIGSATRMEKPLRTVYGFVKRHQQALAARQVCYYLTCGDSDETMLLNIPGKPPHLIGGRNYLVDIQCRFPNIRPLVVGAFGGRQVMPTLNRREALILWFLGKVAREGTPWQGLDVWESLIPERVEAFANEIRQRVLHCGPHHDPLTYRSMWESLQPGTMRDPTQRKYTPKPYQVQDDTDTCCYRRRRFQANGLADAVVLITRWADERAIDLRVCQQTDFNIYYHATRRSADKPLVVHIVLAVLPEDPDAVHASFRCYAKRKNRTQTEEDIHRAEELMAAHDGTHGAAKPAGICCGAAPR